MIPGDDDTKEFIDRCKQGISLPQFRECFRERTENWWETFAELEAELRQMMDEDKEHTRGAETVSYTHLGDKEIRDQILKGSDQKQIKARGRKVRCFDQKVWDRSLIHI